MLDWEYDEKAEGWEDKNYLDSRLANVYMSKIRALALPAGYSASQSKAETNQADSGHWRWSRESQNPELNGMCPYFESLMGFIIEWFIREQKEINIKE